MCHKFCCFYSCAGWSVQEFIYWLKLSVMNRLRPILLMGHAQSVAASSCFECSLHERGQHHRALSAPCMNGGSIIVLWVLPAWTGAASSCSECSLHERGQTWSRNARYINGCMPWDDDIILNMCLHCHRGAHMTVLVPPLGRVCVTCPIFGDHVHMQSNSFNVACMSWWYEMSLFFLKWCICMLRWNIS